MSALKTNRRKVLNYLVPILMASVISLAWIQFGKPVLVNLVKAQIPKLNESQKEVQVSLEDFDISILRLRISLIGLKVNFLEPKYKLEPLEIRRIDANLDLFNLIIGIARISKLQIDGLNWSYAVPHDKSNEQLPLIPVEKIFSEKENLPVTHIFVTNSHVKLKAEKLTPEMEIEIGRARLSNSKNEFELELTNVSASVLETDKSPITIRLEGLASANPASLNLSKLNAEVLSSNIQLSGSFKEYEYLLRKPKAQVKLGANVNLSDIRSLALTLFPQKNRLPSISGQVKAEGEFTFDSIESVDGRLSAETTQVVLDHFKLGQANIKTTISKNQISINEVSLEHPSGRAKLSNIKIEQKSPYKFGARIDFDQFDLQKLFASIGLQEIPAQVKASGSATCEGLVADNPFVNCNIDTGFENIWVKSSQKSENFIVKLRTGRAKGELKVDKEKVSYRAQLSLGNSSNGSSHGEIVFREGFKINYESNVLDFADVESLAGLKILGQVKILGNTYGDSSYGRINATLSATNAEIDDFRLGSFSSTMTYKAGQLEFENLLGAIGKTDVKAQLLFNFTEGTIKATAESSNLSGEDLLSVLNRRFNLPFELNGIGNLKAEVNGPFNFWKLKYDIDSQLSQGSIAGERFDTLRAKIQATGDKIEFRDVKLKKLKSNLGLEGSIVTTGEEPEFNLKIKLNPLQLEESDYVLKYAPSIAGTGYAEGTILGPLSKPNLETNLTLKQITYDKIEYPNSQGKLILNHENLSFNGQFFGRQIQTDFLWPWKADKPFYSKVLIQDLNPLFLLPLISLPQPGSDFYSRLNAEVDISSKTRSFANADGFIKISDLLLQRGNQSLRLTKPAHLYFRSGLKEMEDLNLTGDDSYLRLKMESASSQKVKMGVEANLQMRLFHFLVPFAQTLSGNLSVNSQFSFKENGIELFGEGEVTDGQVSLKGFPQPIQNIHAPIEFSKSKIILSDITGQLGTSDLSGLGQVEILGARNIVVQLRAIADNVQLEFPSKVITQGKAHVLFSGNWLPYNLKVDYKVYQGLVENNFEPDPKQSASLKASAFLPPQQAQLLSPSLSLDVNVDLTNGILVRNKILEGEAKGNLQVQGSPEQPILTGKINIAPGSKLIFKDKPFEIQNANIQFQGTKEINPEIYISSSARVSDYDISLLVQGLAKSLNFTTTSQPPLSQNDIFTLLALGVTSQGNQTLSSETQQKQTGLEVLAALSNQSQLNKKIQEKLGLTLQLAPSVDSTKNIAVPKVVVSKKISKKINASYSKPFTGNDQNQEVKLQYLYNNNLSLQVNYQNKDTIQQDQITNTNSTNKSIWGLDLEFRDEFK